MSDNAMGQSSTFRKWIPLITLTILGFTFNTTEYIPIGLLTDIGSDFGLSESQAGMIITVYAWVVMIASLPLMMLFAKMEFKKLLILIVGLFVLSHIASSVAIGFNSLMGSRIGVALCHAIFWSITPPLAVKIAPDGKKSLGLAMIIGATSTAMVAGLPVGRVIGLYVGWRVTFAVIGVLSLILLISIFFYFPKIESTGTVKIKELPKLIFSGDLGGIYLLTAVAITGHYAAYSYIEPFLAQVSQMSADVVTIALAVFGGIGIIGSYLFNKLFAKFHYFFVGFAVIGTGIFVLLLQFSAISPITMFLCIIGWGLGITAYNLAYQYEIIRFAPQSTAIAMSIYSGIYNLGIGGGAMVGGKVIDNLGIKYIGMVGGAICLVGGIFVLFYLIPRFKKVPEQATQA